MSDMKIEVGDTVMVPATVLHIDGGETYLELPEKPGRYQFRTETISAWNARAGGNQKLIENARAVIAIFIKGSDYGVDMNNALLHLYDALPAPPTEASK